MERKEGKFLDFVGPIIDLGGASVLEVGSGDGINSMAIAQRCRELIGVEPDKERRALAQKRGIVNARFVSGSSDKLDFKDSNFDVVMFTLSLHHVPLHHMAHAINEAVRVVKREGFVVFVEPGMEGSFFEAEIRFKACDGDERAAKRAARLAIAGNHRLLTIREFRDEVIFSFDSTEDFIGTMHPRTNIEELDRFIMSHGRTLRAERWIGICCVEKR